MHHAVRRAYVRTSWPTNPIPLCARKYELSGEICKHKLLQITVGQPRFGTEGFNEWLREATADMEAQEMRNSPNSEQIQWTQNGIH
eukprot:5124820-Amphidinium_carterae.2